jgi:hypothetical protein
VNLSDAFTFEEQERLASDNDQPADETAQPDEDSRAVSDSDVLEMKIVPPKDLLGGTKAASSDLHKPEETEDTDLVDKGISST